MPSPRPTVSASAGADASVGNGSAPQTLPALFWDRVESGGDQVALRHKDLGVWEEISWRTYGEQVRACGFGLLALGLEPGERVAILSEDQPEWLYADLGIMCAGGVSVGIYATSSAEQCTHIVADSGARIWIVEDQEQYDKAAEVREQLPDLRWIVVVDPRGMRRINDAQLLTFADLLERGRALEQTAPERLQQRMADLQPDDMAILIYTSGTTGPPKGVVHSHRSFLDGGRAIFPLVKLTRRDETLCYLPLCHALERWLSLVLGLLGAPRINFAESPETLFRDLREVAPTCFSGVPRTWEKLKAQVDIDMDEATWTKRLAYRLALDVGWRAWRCRRKGVKPSLWLRLLRGATDFAVLRKLRQRLGLHRVRQATVGAAPMAPEVLEFFQALGVPLREGYGATETGFTIWTPEDAVRPGKAGVPVPGVEFRVDEDGEILCRSSGLLIGYFNNPEATAKVLQDGWFRTGDRGRFDEEGYLQYGGRAVDMMVLSSGRNVAPQNIENMLKASSYIMDAVVVGDGRSHLTALIILDEETAGHYAQRHEIPFSSHADLATHPDMVRLIRGEVESVNQRWSDREQIFDFRILNWELSSEDDELTPTMKVRRQFLCARYADLIEEMYQGVEV